MSTEESVAAEKQVAKEDLAAAQVPENRGRQRPRSTYVVAALVVVLFAALGTAAFVGRGTVKSDDLLVTFAWMLIPPLVGAAVALAFGRRLLRRLPRTAGADPTTRRRIGQALRDGSTDDPRLDALARKEARTRVSQRWLLLLFVAGLLTQVGPLVSPVRPFGRLLAALLILLWGGAAWWRWRGLREARRYLAGPPSQP
ncbi:hypothetical protein OG992_14420 [Micromonospora sp. NBC_00362]|uniref:hypothetical protein n=1 Tax=unclassified Micromonospora TaxID=2617518 RepID=UPI00225115D4|nr:hypothetical protein [Micromonospora sp. NBC_00362]MCX5118380.1 hypothetical protein [Micromonospora sp. NBC_00362]WTI09454.1 hypothetical protein OHB44_07230 [Micromonospora sp. NBC_00821]